MNYLNTFKITYDNGLSYVTSMACDLKEASRYFLWSYFEQEDEKTMLQVIRVEEV